MISDLKQYHKQRREVNKIADDEFAKKLFDEHSILAFTRQESNSENSFWVLQWRNDVFLDAYFELGYSGSAREFQLTEVFSKFAREYGRGFYDYLLPKLRDQSLAEEEETRDDAFKALGAVVQNLGQEKLTDSQIGGMESLRSWIAFAANENNVYTGEDVYASGA